MDRLWKETVRFLREHLTGEGGKLLLFVSAGMMALTATGCGGSPETNDAETSWADEAEYSSGEEDFEDVEVIKAVYRDVRDRADGLAEDVSGTPLDGAAGNTSDDLNMIRSIVEELGERGYAAVDSENQVNMTCPEQIRRFCGKVEAQEKAAERLIVVVSKVSFVRYDFAADNGKVNVQCSCFQYKDDWEMVSTKKYAAHTWVYSGGDYLFFEEYHGPGFDGPTGHTAVRIEPLSDKCQELNRKYLREIGYGLNNLFTADWSENDFRKLNFYDLYEAMHQMKQGKYAASFLEEGINYEIPASEFEGVFQAFFRIDGQTLRQHTVYDEETETYRYRARGTTEIAPTPYIPYPEVISWEENPDETVKLTVNAVWAEENTERAFCHEVVIRPFKNGGFQYVSNHVIPSEDDVEVTWYTERLTDEQWRKHYGGFEGNAAEVPVREKAEAVSVLTAEEERRLQEEAREAAALCAEYYRESGVFSSQTGASGLQEFSGTQRKGIVECLGKQGLVSVSDGINMENHEKVEEFYAAYTAGADAMVTVFEIYREGDLCAKTLIYRKGSLQSYYVSAGLSEGETPVIRGAGVKDLEEMRMTEKGYLIYTNRETVMHGNLREYYRVKPLSDRCRELTDRYIHGLSYVNYNMLVTDWDAGNVEDILMPCMFEDIYRIFTGESFRAENGSIPAKTYERIMTTCFPVSVEQLRKHCGYRADTDSYPYEMIFGRQFPPFGEVVDYTEHKDGTITLYVEGVWIDYDSDEAFANTITVQPFADGTFRYLSNTIEEREVEIPKAGE